MYPETSFTTTMFALAIPATAMMVVLWHALLASAPLSNLNSFAFLTPAFGLILGILLFDETFSPVEMSGIGITVVGLVIVVKTPRKTEIGHVAFVYSIGSSFGGDSLSCFLDRRHEADSLVRQ
jgi:EamA domain-containing membrane protein RarD